jgi:hypothetical protein
MRYLGDARVYLIDCLAARKNLDCLCPNSLLGRFDTGVKKPPEGG